MRIQWVMCWINLTRDNDLILFQMWYHSILPYFLLILFSSRWMEKKWVSYRDWIVSLILLGIPEQVSKKITHGYLCSITIEYLALIGVKCTSFYQSKLTVHTNTVIWLFALISVNNYLKYWLSYIYLKDYLKRKIGYQWNLYVPLIYIWFMSHRLLSSMESLYLTLFLIKNSCVSHVLGFLTTWSNV